ncbi:cytochrome c maturation protein CcmE [Dasania sp. GY-MA-18]|uniref:Cytochrome c-type biogenesis protein CcmE n=1 Tax=Dasania phycosphaerae TaxID=2950436 RepID=A0A9J6RI38_9GAMM|nr:MULTISPECIES: cytochrome c maturation protein CcmE [Dasania]MCR8921695.1 cytochrome c maturation protein CcmE [Dasania sp. GY-MA-18]MCZ0864123.1 cytochrome c maturation protein CcmE [Dasania phycosphaerae]MCZ0867851.1 cytochrome c maturation protein CcmE [Dasania phycosphaerae]
MHPVRKQRLIVVLLIVAGSAIAVALAAYALRSNINLFYPPSDIAAGKAPVGKNMRAGGMVLEGSVKRDPDSLRVDFIVTDYSANVPVTYVGILPDLFDEGQGVVASGQLNEQGVFIATEVLAKHDENYMPPEVQSALDAAQQNGDKAAAPLN